MPTRTGHARWEGNLKEGSGEVAFGGGLLHSRYSFGSRFEEGQQGTNPEEEIRATG